MPAAPARQPRTPEPRSPEQDAPAFAPAPLPRTFDPIAGAPEPARRHHFHWGGAVYAVTTLMLAVGAINSQNNLLFWAFGLAVSAIIVSGVLGGWGLMGLGVGRVMPGTLRVAETGEAVYVVTNRNRLFPACAITLTEDAPARVSAGAGRASSPVAFIGFLGPRRTVEIRVPIAGLSRGPIEWLAVRATSTFPLGMALKSVTSKLPARTLVTPRVAPVRAEALRRLRSRGHDSQTPGRRGLNGDEFWGLREHADGDDRRLIAWKPSARSTELLVRITRPRTARRVWLRVLPREGDDRERALSVAASIARAADRAGIEVGLIDGGRALAPSAGARHLARLEAILADERESGDVRAAGRGPANDATIDLGSAAGSQASITLALTDTALREWTLAGEGWPDVSLAAPEDRA
ncbi:MAG: DUF58 domain-containing protein [Planctomycetota bacterium]|nr:DUF58 domain-containing protein [Planctomycetota bacterium]